MPEDEPKEVPDDCRVFRVVHRDWVKEVDGEERPSSQAFQNHRDDGLMSVYVEEDWEDTDLAVENLIKRWGEDYRVCWLRAGDIRELGEKVYRAPNDEFPGHGAVEHPGSRNRPQGVKSRMAKKAQWYEPGS
ncbi:hypothetical protein ACGFMK_26215 [Amycolatopsis sp. NPDC049252]|uniref:hypothetical protein n=1 Tax=Amycolatopsis sp. NPDC049252 TaxID=3363933 RepID=UPI00371AA1CC